MNSNIKKVAKYLSIAALGSMLIGILYCTAVVRNAREYAVRTILPDLRISRWRMYDGSPISFEIRKDDLSAEQIHILLKVQDPGFYSHHGIDLTTPGAGLTTITQALVKKLYFKRFKSGFRKLKQSLIARYVVDELISKDDQITIFANSMFFGTVNEKPIVGIQAAAKCFFNKTVKDLSTEEFISLIATIVAPSTFSPITHPEWNKLRSERIQKMVSGEYVPLSLMDQYYGPLPREVVEAGLPTCSYFPSLYSEKRN